MRIAILTETFSKKMGYLQNTLPKYLSRLGCDVHVISMDLPPYYQASKESDSYKDFSGAEAPIAGTVEQRDGYILHTLAHKRVFGYVRPTGLAEKLHAIRPDVVQTMAAIGWIPMDAATLKLRLGFKLFTGSHNAASTYSLANQNLPWWSPTRVREFCIRAVPGRLVSLLTEKCYGVTKDCSEIAWRFYGVQKHKVITMHLGVDTDYFYPPSSLQDRQERDVLREKCGFGPDDIVCIYTGKFTHTKNPIMLSRAITRLRSEGIPFRALFIGDGVQSEALQAAPWSTVLPFMHYGDLGKYYRAADVGVWPTNESISMLDAAACGLPLIVSDGIVYREHVDGNGYVFKMNDVDDLVAKLRKLWSTQTRHTLGGVSAAKMREKFSMRGVAELRLRDYRLATHKYTPNATKGCNSAFEEVTRSRSQN